jgi:circadian clock protein KaiC
VLAEVWLVAARRAAGGGEGEGWQQEVLREVRGLNDRLRRLEERVEGLLSIPGEAPRGYLRTYVDGLDDALGGGLPAGSVVLVKGPAGSGKTSLALTILGGNDGEGHRSLYIGVEEGRESMARRLSELGLGHEGMVVDLARMRREHPEVDGVGHWLAVLEGFLARRRTSQGITTVAVDPFSGLLELTPLRNPRADLFHFFSRLRSLGLTSILVYDEGPFRFQEDAIADGVLHLSSPEGGEARLVVPKMRGARHTRTPARLEVRGGRLVVRPAGGQ